MDRVINTNRSPSTILQFREGRLTGDEFVGLTAQRSVFSSVTTSPGS